MGRKIPGKKHHSVKDPDKQRQVRENCLKNKINAPPKNPCEQEISRTLKKLMDYKKRLREKYEAPCKKECKEVTREYRKSKSPKLTDDMKRKLKRLSKPEKPAVSFVQLPGESNKSFLTRVNRTCQEFINEVRFENKYGVRVKQNPVTGDIECEKLPKNEFDEMNNECRRKNRKTPEICDLLSKSQKKKLKLNEKLKKKELERIDEFDKYKDPVQFGETARCPPTLSKPKNMNPTITSRPGTKNLLLKELFTKSTSELDDMDTLTKTPCYIKATSSERKITIDTKGKRKHLPHAMRQKIEKQQNDVIEAYRSLKLKK